MKKIEQEIQEKEDEVKIIKKEMEKEENLTDYIKLEELQRKIDKLNKEIEEKMMKWDELSNLTAK